MGKAEPEQSLPHTKSVSVRFTFSFLSGLVSRLFFVAFRFVHGWRMFIRKPETQEVVKTIPNETLLCHHGGLIYPLDLATESDYESV